MIIEAEAEYADSLVIVSELLDCSAGSEEEQRLMRLVAAIESYEHIHYPIPEPEPEAWEEYLKESRKG